MGEGVSGEREGTAVPFLSHEQEDSQEGLVPLVRRPRRTKLSQAHELAHPEQHNVHNREIESNHEVFVPEIPLDARAGITPCADLRPRIPAACGKNIKKKDKCLQKSPRETEFLSCKPAARVL